MSVTVLPITRTAVSADRLGSLGATLQTGPEDHIAYYGVTADVIAQEIVQIPQWQRSTTVAVGDDGRLVGWMMAETDDEVGRIWWWGPVVDRDLRHTADRDAVADEMYTLCRALVPTGISEEELAADDRNALVWRFAQRHGFVPEEASVALKRHDVGATRSPADAVRAFEPADAAAMARLHDTLFPGTHTLGSQLAAADRHGIRLVAEIDRTVIGYVIVEIQPDASGYIDYVGVEPTARGRGVGRSLVGAALEELGRRGVDAAHLTVRESNDHARRLYRSLGFVEDRVLRPYRKGFALDS